MSLILCKNKGSKLTIDEMGNNLKYLDTKKPNNLTPYDITHSGDML